MDFAAECVYRPLEAQLVVIGFFFGVVVFVQLAVGVIRTPSTFASEGSNGSPLDSSSFRRVCSDPLRLGGPLLCG